MSKPSGGSPAAKPRATDAARPSTLSSLQLCRSRKAVPENDIQSFMGQENWRQRIRKENAHAPKSAQFSVRNACRTLDVPKKPCQVHPRGAAIQTASLSMEDSRSFARSYAPNEQFLWPETAQHNVGWLIEDPQEGRRAIPVNERTTILGPSHLGFGWRRRSAEKRQECCESVLPRQVATPSTAPSSRKSSVVQDTAWNAGNAAFAVPSPAEKALPWFPGIGKLRRQRRLQRNQVNQVKQRTPEASPHLYGTAEILSLERRERAVAASSDLLAPALSPPAAEASEQRPQTALPGNSAGLRVFLAQPVEDRWLRATSHEAKLKPSTADHQLISSRSATCREFLRHGARSQWEREKPVSAMSSFAHGYTMLWGVNFFSRRGSQRP